MTDISGYAALPKEGSEMGVLDVVQSTDRAGGRRDPLKRGGRAD